MTVSKRILSQLSHGGATVRQLSMLVPATEHHIRHCLSTLKRKGAVRQTTYADRACLKGAMPRYWEIT